MLALLGDQVLPDEKLDVGIAVTVLDSILRLPGGQLNKTRLAAELGIDQRTVSRYLGILDRRFLLTFLPNLRTGLTRTSKTMPKVHSSDSSATCEAISRAGRDIASSPEALETQETPTLSEALSENPSDPPDDEDIIELLETFLESNVPAFSQRSEDFKKVFTAFGETFKRELSKLPSGNIPSTAALARAANRVIPTRIDLDKATDALATAWTALDDTLTRLLRLVGESGLAEHGKKLKEMFSGLSRSMNSMDFGGMNQQVQMLSAMSGTMRPAASTLSRVLSTTRAIAKSAEIWEENL